MNVSRCSLLALALLTAGCTGDGEEEELVQIGSILSTSGDLAGIGAFMISSATLAVEEINASGGVLGKTLQIVNIDDRTEAGGAGEAAAQHLENGVPVVIGAIGSSYTMETVEYASQGMVVISPTSTSPALTTIEDNGYLFRTCPSDALQGALMAGRAIDAGLTRAAILHVPGAYGEGMAETFEVAFEEAGGEVTFSEAYEEGKSSYSDVLAEIVATEPDTIILPAYPVDGARIVSDYLTGFSGEEIFFYLSDALADDDFINLVGADNFHFGHEGTAPSGRGPFYDDFAAAYEAQTGDEPGIYQSNVYDAVYLAALAIEAAGSLEAETIRDALGEIAVGGEAHGPATAMDAAASGADLNFEGASGSLDFDEYGDVSGSYAVWSVSEGAVEVSEIVDFEE